MTPPPPPARLATLLLLLLSAAAAARVPRQAGYPRVVNGAPEFGDWCDENEDCAGGKSVLECRYKKCLCPDGFEFTNGFCKKDNREALARLPRLLRLGDWCEESADCALVSPNMRCANALCVCERGFVLQEGSCKPEPTLPPRVPQPGDFCEETEDCTLADPNMECTAGLCLCKAGHFLLNGLCSDGTTTVPELPSPPPPATTAAPPPPASTPPPKAGDPCKEHSDCSRADKNLQCNNSRCACKAGHELDGGLCKPRMAATTARPSRLGDWCVMDADCGAAPGHLECFGGVCLCRQGYAPSDGLCAKESAPTTAPPPPSTTRRARPAKPAQLGDWCADSLDCQLGDDHMECFSEVCLCKRGYVHRDGLCRKEIVSLNPHWSWEKTSSYGALCEESTDCPSEENMECQRGFCECMAHFFQHEGTCKRMITKIGAACNETTDVCYLEGADGDVGLACLQGKCLCKEGFVLVNGRCKKYINKLGARCHPDRHICSLERDVNDAKTECRDETCQCRDGYEEEEGQCAIGDVNKELGASCKSDKSCSSILNARCNDMSKCTCKEGYGPLSSKVCGKLVGDRCDDGKCDALNTQCIRKTANRNEVRVCACKPYHLSSSNRTFCYTWPQQMGDLCDQSAYCMFLGDNVECIEGRCQCNQGFALQDGFCIEKMGS